MKWSGYGYWQPETDEQRKQRTVRSLELQIIDREFGLQ